MGELQRMALSRLRGADTPLLATGDLLNDAAPPAGNFEGHIIVTAAR